MIKKFTLSLLLLSACLIKAMALSLPEPMQPVRLVNDFAQMLTPEEENRLEQKLTSFSAETSTQIAIVTIEELQGTAISDYAAQLFDKWGIGGSAKKDNGILLLVKPKTASERGEVFIATGYGVEGAVPDALAGRIVDYDILPAFREGEIFNGLDRATTSLMELTRGEYTADEYLAKHESSGQGWGIVLALLFLLFIGFLGSKENKHSFSSKGDVASTLLWTLLLSGRNHRGGSGGFGGFSGGGFGGFGGGSTGGGGAGGSW